MTSQKSTLIEVPSSMKAAVYRGPDDLRVETVPVPGIRPGELLVRVAACGVCPTDIKKILHGTVPPPRVFGHETSGMIVKVGAGVRGWRVGDRVALHHHIPCMTCHFCRHQAFAQCPQYKRTGVTAGFEPAGGGFAEFVRVMPFVLRGVVKIPPKNTYLEGAMLEPVNTVLKAVRHCRLQAGDCVLVAGQGPIGLMFTRLLALEGVRVVVTDLFSKRLQLASALGALHCLRGDAPDLKNRILRFTKGRGLDAAIVAVPSNDVVTLGWDCLRGGGLVMLFAHTKRGAQMPVDLSVVCVDEKTLAGSYSADVTLQQEVADLVFSRKINMTRLVSHVYPLERAAEAVKLAANPTPGSLKVVICPWAEAAGIQQRAVVTRRRGL